MLGGPSAPPGVSSPRRYRGSPGPIGTWSSWWRSLLTELRTGQPMVSSRAGLLASCLGRLGASPADRERITMETPALVDLELDPGEQYFEQHRRLKMVRPRGA